MKVSDVIKQMYKTLPFITDKFTDSVDISQIDFSGNTVTVQTSDPHGLDVSDSFTLYDVFSPLNITSITRTGATAIVVTDSDHDLTKNYQEEVEIYNANEAEFNGTFQIADVIDGTSFKIIVADSGPTEATGSPILKETTGFRYNSIVGFKTVATVVDPNTFTYTIAPTISGQILAVGAVAVGFRVTGAVNFESAYASYTQQDDGKLWAFVSSEAMLASKDRRNNSDSVYQNSRQGAYKQQINQNIYVYVFATVTNEFDAFSTKDDMQDVFSFFNSSICGAKIDSGTSSGDYFALVFDSHNTQLYNHAIYAHTFIYQNTGQLSNDDVFNDNKDVALRSIDVEMNVVVDDLMIKPNTESMDSTINL